MRGPNNPARDTSPQPVPSWSCLRGDSSPMGWSTMSHLQQLSGASFGWKRVTAYIGMRRTMGCIGKTFWYCAMLICGSLADEPNTGKGKYQGG